MQSVNQLIYETLGNTVHDVVAITGLDEPDVVRRRAQIAAFLEEGHEWDIDAFNVWVVRNIPSLLQRMKNFAEAVVEHAAKGWTKATDELKDERYAACRSCEHFLDGNVCAQCGCYMEVKTGWNEAKCPLGKW